MYSRADAGSSSSSNVRTNTGAGSPAPPVDRGETNRAVQSTGDSSATSNGAGALHADAQSPAAAARTRSSPRARDVSGANGHATSTWSAEANRRTSLPTPSRRSSTSYALGADASPSTSTRHDRRGSA